MKRQERFLPKTSLVLPSTSKSLLILSFHSIKVKRNLLDQVKFSKHQSQKTPNTKVRRLKNICIEKVNLDRPDLRPDLKQIPPEYLDPERINLCNNREDQERKNVTQLSQTAGKNVGQLEVKLSDFFHQMPPEGKCQFFSDPA